MAQKSSPAVPPLNLAANFEQIRDELMPALERQIAAGQFVLGPAVQDFERALAQATGARYALGMSSGTDAILCAFMTLGIGPGDEVIVPTFTFFASAGCVSRVGARPMFCDVDAETFNIDPASFEAAITPRTRAVMPVHLYGQLADMPAILDIAQRRKLHVIEDACQAILSRPNGVGERSAGAIGDLGCLSFYPTKNLGAMGDAGALLTNDASLFERARLLRTHGEQPRYHHHMIGGNFRLDALQALVLSVKLRHLNDWTVQRRQRAANYVRLFEQAGLSPERVRLPVDRTNSHVYHQFVIRVPRRDELLAFLQSRQIGAGVYYPIPLHLQDCFKSLGGKPGQFPVAEQAAKDVLGLPIYPELTDAQQTAVVEAIAEFYRR